MDKKDIMNQLDKLNILEKPDALGIWETINISNIILTLKIKGLKNRIYIIDTIDTLEA